MFFWFFVQIANIGMSNVKQDKGTKNNKTIE